MGEFQRRRWQRHPSSLPVEYRFSREARWRTCRIIDVSEQGATVELQDLARGESFGERIDLEISSVPQDGVGVVLRARIRRRSRQPDGLVIGVEFMPTDCVNLLRLLAELHPELADAWREPLDARSRKRSTRPAFARGDALTPRRLHHFVGHRNAGDEAPRGTGRRLPVGATKTGPSQIGHASQRSPSLVSPRPTTPWS